MLSSPSHGLGNLPRNVLALVFDDGFDFLGGDERDITGDRPFERRGRRGVLEGGRYVVAVETTRDERAGEGVAGADRIDGCLLYTSL
ncbi:hypothetical protein C486_07609, partial [Natrinema gari JCM 14663]